MITVLWTGWGVYQVGWQALCCPPASCMYNCVVTLLSRWLLKQTQESVVHVEVLFQGEGIKKNPRLKISCSHLGLFARGSSLSLFLLFILPSIFFCSSCLFLPLTFSLSPSLCPFGMSPDSFLLTTFSLLLFWKKLFNCFSPCKFRCNSIICNLYYSYWLFISVFLIVLIYLYHMWLIFYISECMYCHTCLKPAVWPLAPSRWFISPNHLHLTLAVKVIWSAQKIVKNAFLHAAPARRSHAFVFVSVYECVIHQSAYCLCEHLWLYAGLLDEKSFLLTAAIRCRPLTLLEPAARGHK